MNSNAYFIILRNNSFICKKADHRQYVFTFEDIENRPNIPFYHHIWNENFEEHIKQYKDFCRYEVFNEGIFPKLVKNTAYVALPDDAMELDDKIVNEFLVSCGSRKVIFSQECVLLSRDQEYIAVSRTCRMWVLSYILGRSIKDQRFLDNQDYSVEEIKSYIQTLSSSKGLSAIPIYITGYKVEHLSPVGSIVEPETILDHYIATLQ